MPRRELRITYGSYVAGQGQAKRQPVGPFSISDSSDAFSFSFTLQIAGTTSAADLATEIAAATTAFRTPRSDLLVELVNAGTGASEGTLLSAAHSTGEALNVEAEISQPQDQEGQSGRSVRFDVIVRGGRPADYDAAALRSDLTYEVSTSPSRVRTLVVRGTYTHNGSGTASLAGYNAAAGTKIATIQVLLGGAWAAVPGIGERTITDDTDHVTTWERSFRELIHNESAGLLDDPDIANELLVIEAATPGADDDGSSASAPLIQVLATFRADVDKDVITGVPSLRSLWDGRLLPWVIQNIRDATGGSDIAVIESGPSYDPKLNVLTARVRALASQGSTSLLSRVVITSESTEWRHVFRPYYADRFPTQGEDPAPTPHDVSPGSAVILRTVSTTDVTISGRGARGGGGAGQRPADGVGRRVLLSDLGKPGPVHIRFPGQGAVGFGIGDNFSIVVTPANGGRGQLGGIGGGGGSKGAGGGLAGGAFLIRRERPTIRTQRIGIAPNTLTLQSTTTRETVRVVGPAPQAAGESGSPSSMSSSVSPGSPRDLRNQRRDQ